MDFDVLTTRGGDKGESGLYNGQRLRKDDLLFELLGDLDELSSFLGLAKTAIKSKGQRSYLEEVQRKLLIMGGLVATPVHDPLFKTLKTLHGADIEELERQEKRLLDSTPVSREFILPGENLSAAYLDVARAVCRRAERKMVKFIGERGGGHLASSQVYLNRLSDYLFILARAEGR